MGVSADSSGSDTQICRARSQVTNRECLLGEGFCGVIIRQSLPWATGNLFGECHTPYTLKIHFVDFEKE